jgi:hypothetical protein
MEEKFQKKKFAKFLYFTYTWGRTHPTDCNGSLNVVKVTSNINHGNFDGCMLRGLVYAKG